MPESPEQRAERILCHTHRLSPLDCPMCIGVAQAIREAEQGAVEPYESREASLADCLNTELRENYGAAYQVEPGQDFRPAIKQLVDGARYGERFAMKGAVEREREKRRGLWEALRESDLRLRLIYKAASESISRQTPPITMEMLDSMNLSGLLARNEKALTSDATLTESAASAEEQADDKR